MFDGASPAKPVVPCLTPMWGDIPVTRLHIPPRPEAVVSCGRDEIATVEIDLAMKEWGDVFTSFPSDWV